MDVDAALEALVEALESSDTEQAIQSIEDILQWMRKGGFAPKIEFHTLEFLLGTLADLLKRQ